MFCKVLLVSYLSAAWSLKLGDPSIELTKELEQGRPHSPGAKIVCTGWKKTGTTSVHRAYDLLGIGPTCGVNKCKSPRCMDHCGGTEDAYACCNTNLVQMQKELYTKEEVKFVHLERHPKKWRASVDSWLTTGKRGHLHGQYSKLMTMSCSPGESCAYGTEAFYRGYESHNKMIKNMFRDDPSRLLVLNLEDHDPVKNMQAFCEFVGVDNKTNENCNNPFPHANANPVQIAQFDKHNLTMGTTNDWLHVDEQEDEGVDFDADLATRDWVAWYAKQGIH